ncbi:MAG: hypothetical protein ACJ8F3_04505 [Xanthobacteraceae bacterium]
MSSPKAATRLRRPAANEKAKPAASLAVAAALPSAAASGGTDVSADAIRLAQEIERQFAQSENVLSVEAMQTLMSSLCRVYSAQVEGGAKHTPIPEGQVVSPTGVMLTASGLLRAANLAVFELGMWQSWTGR